MVFFASAESKDQERVYLTIRMQAAADSLNRTLICNVEHIIMTICRLCNITVSNGVHLSDGGIIHSACIESIERKLQEEKTEVQDLTSKASRFATELKRRGGVGFKFISFFSKPKMGSSDVEEAISAIERNIINRKIILSDLVSKLSLIYDYFLSYPPDWEERRTRIIEASNEKCSNCQNRKRLHIHHKIPLSRGGSNKICNLELLCEKCHSKKHGGMKFSKEFSNNETAFAKRVSNIRYAIENRRKIAFQYKKPNQTKYKKRIVRPIELVNIDHQSGTDTTLCISGYCELRKANRNFALKRMRGLKLL